ncbi:MAG: hypothetical protein ACOCTP_03315 [Roseicyclus sp.]
MLRALVFLVVLGLLAGLVLLGYSYTGLMTPERERVTVPVDLGRD